MRLAPSFVRRLFLLLFFLGGSSLYGLLTGTLALSLMSGLTLAGFILLVDWFLFRGTPDRVAGWITGSAVGLLVGGSILTLFQAAPLNPLDPLVWITAGTGIYLGGVVGEFFLGKVRAGSTGTPVQPSPAILDSSVLIDGRIVELVDTGFLEGPFFVPQFVLKELQNLADSEDRLTRNRGRRGLEILERLREETEEEVVVPDWDRSGGDEVDDRLVEEADRVNGRLVTNDYNLHQVAELQKVPVLNVNELSNAVQPVFIPGEQVNLEIVKQGEEPHQGVGYLNDGTMIVVEEAGDRVGEQLEVAVTSVIQTRAGRMVFAKPLE